ncbi:MAG: hypothetical protein JXM69_18160 [Anaerolineae bacterium]|nr:hypothetical protein [Anaerolineae bacterium]
MSKDLTGFPMVFVSKVRLSLSFDNARGKQRKPVRSEIQAATAAKLDALLPSILDRAFKGEL